MTMAKTKSNKMKTEALAVPKTQAEAEQLLGRIGKLQRQVAFVEVEMNEELAKVKGRFEGVAQPKLAEIDRSFQALHAWAEANKTTLLKGKAKTVKLATGEISWRSTPPAVMLKNVAGVIAQLKDKGLLDFLRIKVEVNKEAILAEPAKAAGIKGLKIESREEFVAKPFESEIERAEPCKAAA
jgi:phage host-nuclease inhibitor protein Gam